MKRRRKSAHACSAWWSARLIYIGLITVWAQVRALPLWRRKYDDQIIAAHALVGLTTGLALLAITPAVPVPGYDRAALEQSLLDSRLLLNAPATAGRSIGIPLPAGKGGWLGVIWLVMFVLPVALSGAVLRPLLNSLVSRKAREGQVGAALGLSTATVSAMNAIAPLVGGLVLTADTGMPFMLGAVAACLALIVMALPWLVRRPVKAV